MRFALLMILGLFLWAGTVSVKFPQQPSTVTPAPKNTCAGQSHEEHLLASLKMGMISSIHDNGQILTIGLSPQWEDLSSHTQQQTYNTVACYAQSQHRPFQFLFTHQM